ncbi:MAG: hypothetical protein CL872_00645 [Dehalococcoidaceae bacterium]|nr:hypothetical protein [Dehalococcoidaceae bacterium]
MTQKYSKIIKMKSLKNFSEKSIKEYLIDNYNLINIKKIQSLPHNNINSRIYKISTHDEKILLRFFTDGVGKYNSTPKKIEKICSIQNNCNQVGLPVQKPIVNKKGKFTDAKNNLFLTKYYDGKIFAGTRNELKNLSLNIALLHKFLKKEKIQIQSQLDQPIRKIISYNELNKINDQLSNKKQNKFEKIVARNSNFILENLEKLQTASKQKLNSKVQLIHNDLHPHNVIFHNGIINSFLDFNSMGIGNVMDDISFASFRFSAFKEKNPKIINQNLKLFINEYVKISPIKKTDKKMYFDFIRKRLLKNISYIIRVKFFIDNHFLWDVDLVKNLNYLKLLSKIESEGW